MNEESSTVERSGNAKSIGIASKDGVTGSDYDGQISGEYKNGNNFNYPYHHSNAM